MLEKCRAIVQLARKYDALIFSDDVYNLLHFDADSHAPPRLFTYDNPSATPPLHHYFHKYTFLYVLYSMFRSDPDYKGGNVLSNGTFSKIMAPGLRLGWIEAGPRIIKLLTFK